MTPALKKCPAVGNRQENSRHEKIFKKSIRGGKLYSLFKKKEKKNLQTINAEEGVEKRTLLDCRWECKLVQPLWRKIWKFLKKMKNRATI